MTKQILIKFLYAFTNLFTKRNTNSLYQKNIILFLGSLAFSLAASLTVALLVYPDKAIIAFLANELDYPCLIYINAILCI